MLRFFKLNDPYRLLGLLALLIVFSLPVFLFPAGVTSQELKSMLIGEAIREGKQLYTSLFDSTAPFSSIIYGFIDRLMGRSLAGRQVISLLLLFFQASFLSIVLIRSKAYTTSSYLPALIFGVLCFFSFDLLSFSPELLGSVFLLMALNNIFKEIEFKLQRDEIILNIGFYLGAASLFLFSFSIFLLGTIVVLLVFTRITIRKYLLLLIGFLLPHLLLMTYYFYDDSLLLLFQNFYYPNLSYEGQNLISWQTLVTLFVIPIIFLGLAFYKLNNEGHFTKYQSQVSQVMFLWMVFSLIQVSITRELTPHSFVIFIPSIAFFTSHYFLLARRKQLAEYVFIIFMTGIVGVSMLGRFNQLNEEGYEKMFIKNASNKIENKKLLVLMDDPGIYQANKLAGYFLDWHLSKAIFNEPDYYENVLLVNKMFETDPPEVIIDPEDKMNAFFKRLPGASSKYKREGDNYYRISN